MEQCVQWVLPSPSPCSLSSSEHVSSGCALSLYPRKVRWSCLALFHREPCTASPSHLLLWCSSVCLGERPGEAVREEKKGISQQRGADSWHRYKQPLPLCHRALTTFPMLFKHLLNELVSAFVLTPYLRVQSGAELQKCEQWRKLLVVEAVNWIAQLENLFEFLVRRLWWLKHQRMGGKEGKSCLIPISQCPDGHAA